MDMIYPGGENRRIEGKEDHTTPKKAKISLMGGGSFHRASNSTIL